MTLALNAQTIAFAIGLAVPMLVAVLAKANVPTSVKVVLNLALTAVAGAAGALIGADGSSFDLNGFASAWLAAFVASTGAYHTVYKPSGATDNLNVITGNFGVGTPQADLPGSAPGDDLQDVPVDPTDEVAAA